MVSDTLNAKAAVYAIKDCKKGWKVWSLEKKKWGGDGFGGKVLLGRKFGSLDEDADEDETDFVRGRNLWHMRFACTFHGFFFSVSWEDDGIWRRSWPRRGLTPNSPGSLGYIILTFSQWQLGYMNWSINSYRYYIFTTSCWISDDFFIKFLQYWVMCRGDRERYSVHPRFFEHWFFRKTTGLVKDHPIGKDTKKRLDHQCCQWPKILHNMVTWRNFDVLNCNHAHVFFS